MIWNMTALIVVMRYIQFYNFIMVLCADTFSSPSAYIVLYWIVYLHHLNVTVSRFLGFVSYETCFISGICRKHSGIDVSRCTTRIFQTFVKCRTVTL